MDGFQMLGLEHLMVLFLCGVGGVIAWRSGRVADERASRRVAILLIVFIVPLEIVWILFADVTRDALPLHLCDLALFVAVYALWTGSERASAVLYFWGLTLSIQGLLTPSLQETFPDPAAVLFWALHLVIVWAAAFQTARVGGPDWDGYRFAVAATLAWVVTMLVFNSIVGTNFGYLNGKPESASALDYIGPWPTYVLVLVLFIVGLWALMTLPWNQRESVALVDVDADADQC